MDEAEVVTAAQRRPPLRVAVDTSVLFALVWLEATLAAADEGLIQPVWSAQVAAELARALLWTGKLDSGRRTISRVEYEDYRRRVYERIDGIDLRCEIVRVSPTAPTAEETDWATRLDVDDLHLQLLARAAGATHVISRNTRHFPGRRVVDGFTRGELSGILWITPEQLPLFGPVIDP